MRFLCLCSSLTILVSFNNFSLYLFICNKKNLKHCWFHEIVAWAQPLYEEAMGISPLF